MEKVIDNNFKIFDHERLNLYKYTIVPLSGVRSTRTILFPEPAHAYPFKCRILPSFFDTLTTVLLVGSQIALVTGMSCIAGDLEKSTVSQFTLGLNDL